MGKIRWYKRDPDAALSGMFELTLEERGAYNTVLDLIYARANNLPDDDRFIAGWLKSDIRVWRRIKMRLVSLGKLRIEAGLICNDRADVEVLEALHRVASASDAGRASGDSRRHKSGREAGKINVLAETDASTERERDFELTTSTPTKEGSEAKASSPHARRIPADWKPRPLPPNVAALVSLWPPSREQREFEGFVDYWTTRSRDAARTDWDKTWHNRIRDQHDRIMRENRNGMAGRQQSGDGLSPTTRAANRVFGTAAPSFGGDFSQ